MEIIQKAQFSGKQFCKLTLADTFRMMPQLCEPFTFSSKRTFCIALLPTQISKNDQVKVDRKKTTAVYDLVSKLLEKLPLDITLFLLQFNEVVKHFRKPLTPA